MDELNRKVDAILKIVENTTSTYNKSTTFKFDVNMYIKCLIHELRTPITTVSLGLNTIEKQILAEEGNKSNVDCCCAEQLNVIRDLYKTIQYIDNTLTKFCVIQDGNLVLNAFESFSIRALMQNVEKILQYNIKEKNIVFVCNIDPNIQEWVYGDGFNIKHCIINLIKNAIKYSKPSTANHITVNISSNEGEPGKEERGDTSADSTQEQTVVITVIDNNNPIPKHIKEKLFEPFNSSSGSGLGLYICKKILELHSGIISHDYLENVGNRFSIVIKFKNCIVMGTTHSSSILPEVKMSDTKYNIMIVDDSAINVNLMRKSFSNNDLIRQIYTAVDGLDTINQICNNMDAIDVLFIDNQMPNLSGTQTVKLLRGGMQYDKLIFGITGSNNSELSEFNHCGIDYVFSKPFDRTKINIVLSFLSKQDIKRYPDKKLQIVNEQLVWV